MSGPNEVIPAPPTAQDTREMLCLARALRDRGRHLLSCPDSLWCRASAQFDALRWQLIVDRLLAMPIECVRDFTRAHLRLTPLRQAGLHTVASLVATPAKHLRRLPGVGPKTATEAVAAAEKLATAIIRETTVRFDPQRRDSAQTALLATLSRLRRALDTVAGLRSRVEAINAELDELLTMAAPAEHPVRLRLARRHNRDSALVAAGQLRRLLFAPSTAGLARELRDRLQELDSWQPEAPWLWHDYQERPASYHALLAGLGDGDRDGGAPQRFVPAQLAPQPADRALDPAPLRLPFRGPREFGVTS